MGMYTYVVEGIIDVKDMEGLKTWLEEMKAGKRPEYVNDEAGWSDTGHNRGPDYAEMVKIDEEKGTVDFFPMDGMKIISYWYPQFCQFLRDIAIFLEDGDIELDFESSEEYGHIRFENGECFITTGQMHYDDEWNINERVEKEMPKDLQKRLVVRRI